MHIGASLVTKVFLFRQSAEKKYEVTLFVAIFIVASDALVAHKK